MTKIRFIPVLVSNLKQISIPKNGGFGFYCESLKAQKVSGIRLRLFELEDMPSAFLHFEFGSVREVHKQENPA